MGDFVKSKEKLAAQKAELEGMIGDLQEQVYCYINKKKILNKQIILVYYILYHRFFIIISWHFAT